MNWTTQWELLHSATALAHGRGCGSLLVYYEMVRGGFLIYESLVVGATIKARNIILPY